MAVIFRHMAAEILIWGFFLTAAIREHRGGHRTAVEKIAQAITTNRAATVLGRCSYSTYLIHIPVFAIVVWLGSTLVGVHSQAVTMIFTGIALILLVPISQALYHFVERPFVTLGNDLAKRG